MCIPESCIEIKINLKCENKHFKLIFTSFCSGMVRLGLIADYIWNVDIWIHTVKDVREGSGYFKFSSDFLSEYNFTGWNLQSLWRNFMSSKGWWNELHNFSS